MSENALRSCSLFNQFYHMDLIDSMHLTRLCIGYFNNVVRIRLSNQIWNALFWKKLKQIQYWTNKHRSVHCRIYTISIKMRCAYFEHTIDNLMEYKQYTHQWNSTKLINLKLKCWIRVNWMCCNYYIMTFSISNHRIKMELNWLTFSLPKLFTCWNSECKRPISRSTSFDQE